MTFWAKREVGRVAGGVGERAGLGDRADERRDASVVAAQLEDLLDDRAVLGLELAHARVGLLAVGALVDLDAQVPCASVGRLACDTAVEAVERDGAGAARQPHAVGHLGDDADARIVVFVAWDEQHALLGTHIHGQGHVHVGEDDEVFQGYEQHRAQAHHSLPSRLPYPYQLQKVYRYSLAARSCRCTKPAYDPLMPRATPLAARNDTPKVGARVRSLRRERGLTIEQLAAATGLTKGFISQLERDRTAPSLSSIARICDALGVRLSHIFEREPAPALVRRNERPKVDSYFPTENHLLSSRDEERFQAIESEVAPGAGAGDELYSLPGEMEFVYVLAGTLEIQVADETHVLEQGDALTYPLSKPHTWRNASDTETLRVLWVSVPNPY